MLAMILLLEWGPARALKENTEMHNSRFSPCPDTPNCVSSRDQGGGHAIEPLHYQGGMVEAKAVLLEVLRSFERTEVVEDSDGYVHAVFRSLVFRFADDVEFEFDDVKKRVHMKSASRAGYWDLGANRRRCESIRAAFSRLIEKST